MSRFPSRSSLFSVRYALLEFARWVAAVVVIPDFSDDAIGSDDSVVAIDLILSDITVGIFLFPPACRSEGSSLKSDPLLV